MEACLACDLALSTEWLDLGAKIRVNFAVFAKAKALIQSIHQQISSHLLLWEGNLICAWLVTDEMRRIEVKIEGRGKGNGKEK